MKLSPRLAAGGICLLTALLTAKLRVEGTKKEVEAGKPPWQRNLQGEEAKKAAQMEEQLVSLQEAGQLEQALKIAERLAELRGRKQGEKHWQAITARFDAVALQHVLKAQKEDQQSYSRVVVLTRQAAACEARGLYRAAQRFRAEVLTIHRKLLGEEHPHTAGSYNNLAYNQHAQGKYQVAEEGYRKALDIQRKLLGEEHPDTATSYNNLAYNEQHQGKYQEAEQGFRKALAICCKLLGEENPRTAGGHNNLAGIQHAQGKYQEAEQGFRKALAICRKLLSEEHPHTASIYNNLAANQQAQGKYQKAEQGYRKVLAIRGKVLGEEHPDTAQSYSNLALNQQDQGKYQEAEQGFRKALAIRRKVLGEEHPDTATSYNTLAANQDAQGKCQEAEEGYRKALDIRRKILGEEHPDTARSYNNLAANQDAQDKCQEAEEGYRKALDILRRLLGEEHPHTAISYNNLAANQHAQGKYREAEQGYRKALPIRRKLLGEEHPHTAASYNNLAYNQHAQGNYQQAEDLLRSASKSFAIARQRVAATGLERATFSSESSPLPLLAAVLARNGKPEQAWQALEESLARGAWDDMSAQLRRPLPEREKHSQLTARIDRLHKRLEKLPGTRAGSAPQKQRDELLGQLRQAYDALADFDRLMQTKYGPIAGEVFSRQRIQGALPADTALLAWLDLPGEAKAVDANGEHWAILMRASAHPLWVRLPGSGAKGAWTDPDPRLPGRLRSALQARDNDWKALARRLGKQRLQPLAQHLKGVRHLVVLPSTALAGVPVEIIARDFTVSYAPSGTLYAHLQHKAPPSGKGLLALADPVFDPPTQKETLPPLPPGGVLLTGVLPGSKAANAGLKPNDVILSYGGTKITGPADFKRLLEAKDSDKPVEVFVWRDGNKRLRPLFVPVGKLGVVFAERPAPEALAEQRRWDRHVLSLRGGEHTWKRLPGTRTEAAALCRLFGRAAPVTALLGPDASEQRLNELAASGELGQYRYVHLATHGDVNNVKPLQSAVILSRDRLPDDRQAAELLLAGQPIPDGLLTAEEVLRRWSLHADLVTLSACQTALGKYERGEGFVGFAQALLLAGSRSVCLSLWQVDDTATALLMERFYQNMLGKREGLSGPMGKAAALGDAKDWLRTLPRAEVEKRAASLLGGQSRSQETVRAASATSRAKPEDCPFAHPRYWAAFVLIGHDS